jgi:hypothetical protein
MLHPEEWIGYFSNREGTLLNWSDATLLPRYLHMMVSAVAVGGLAIALYYDFNKRQGKEVPEERIHLGCQWFSIATIINFGIGFWFLDAIPAAAKDVSTGLGLFFVIFLVGGLISGALSIIWGLLDQVRKTAIAALISLVFMVLMRELLRVAYLKPYFFPTDLQVQPQYSPMILFLIVFAGGLAVMWYMLRLAVQVKEVE